MADDDDLTSDSGGTTDDKISALDRRIDRLAALIARAVPTTRTEAQEHTERRLDRPSSVAEQVQAELDRRDQKAKEAARDGELTTLRETVGKLQEKAPEPVARGIERVMGWRS